MARSIYNPVWVFYGCHSSVLPNSQAHTHCDYFCFTPMAIYFYGARSMFMKPSHTAEVNCLNFSSAGRFWTKHIISLVGLENGNNPFANPIYDLYIYSMSIVSLHMFTFMQDWLHTLP